MVAVREVSLETPVLPRSTKGGNQSAEPLSLKVAKGGDLELSGVAKRQRFGARQGSQDAVTSELAATLRSTASRRAILQMSAQAALAVKFVKQQIMQKTTKRTEGNWGALNTQNRGNLGFHHHLSIIDNLNRSQPISQSQSPS